MAKQRPSNNRWNNEDMHRLAAQVRWFIGLGVAIFSILMGVLIFRPDPAAEALKEIRSINRGYEPVFRRILLDRAYGHLSEVHITEIQSQGELNRNLQEIRASLETVRAFDGRNAGLLMIFELLESMAKQETSQGIQERFLSTRPLRDVSLNMTPQEAGFFITFQGLLLIDRMRAAGSATEYRKFLELALEKLKEAQRLNTGIANMWNGLGILYIDLAHADGNMALIEEARHAFQIAFDLHRSPLNFAANINNQAYARMLAGFHETLIIQGDFAEGTLTLMMRSRERTRMEFSQLATLLNQIETALTYDPNAPSIMLSKAEVLCTMSLYSHLSATGYSDSGMVVSSSIEITEDEYLDQAMDAVRDARLAGFTDWEYLFSRIWIAATLLRVEKYSEELSRFAEH